MTRAGAFVLVATWSGTALAAPTKGECVDANARGQVARKEERLHDARAAFQTCAERACPSVVRRDCEERLDDVNRAMPTIVLEATDVKGKVAFTLTLDGTPFTEGLDGSPVEIDPGPHHFVFHAQGYPHVVRDLAIDEGAHGKPVSASFEQAVLASSPPPGGGLRAGGFALASAGVAGILAGTAFGIASFVTWSSVKSECTTAASCNYAQATPDRNQALAFATVSDVSFVVGGVLAAAGVTLVVLGTRLAPTLAPRVIGFSIEETF